MVIVTDPAMLEIGHLERIRSILLRRGELMCGSRPDTVIALAVDQCAPADPRLPMLADLQQLMRQACYGGPA